MTSQHQRFERYKRKLPLRSLRWVTDVEEQFVTIFERANFQQPEVNPVGVGSNTIVLQRRQGDEWPTVWIDFSRRGRPALSVDFSVLPLVCYTTNSSGELEIVDRTIAPVHSGDAFFSLCKTYGSIVGEFGVGGWRPAILQPFVERRLAKDLTELVRAGHWLVGQFDAGIPKDWSLRPEWRVHERAFRSAASRCRWKPELR